MKMTSLKKSKAGLAGLASLSLTLFLASPAPIIAGGTDILHYTVVTGMTNNGIETDADGAVMATQKQQGKANNQKLSIEVTGLAANTPYELVAAFDNDTNMVDAGPFMTDAHGKATLNYTSLGNGHGGGKKATALPDGLNPVSLVRELDIVDTNLQAVLSADLSMPDKLQYLVKRDLSAGKTKASLLIEANSNKTHFRLLSTGLTPNANYLLVFNDEVVQTNTSNAKGRLDIQGLTDMPPYILDVRSVALWDSSSNVVLQAELP